MATIEFLFVANHAEVQNGLLYAVGAGWSELYRGQPGPEGQFPPNHFSIAVSVSVPWEETNQSHPLVVRIEQEDETVLSGVETEVVVGRPPNVPAETEQRVVFALGLDIVFPAPGGYRVVAKVDGNERSVGFRVYDLPRPPF